MTEADIQEAIGTRMETLLSMLGPIVWPNKDATPQRPYMVFDPVPVSRTDISLTGGFEIASGYVMVSVVTSQNEFTREANGMAQAVADVFPMGLRIEAAGGTVLIQQPPRQLTSYPDGADWRTPVRIDYRTT